MLSYLKKILNSTDATQERYRRLINFEARIGGGLFGKVEPTRQRRFFCLDERTWVWHEEWYDEHKKLHRSTVRYDVYPDGIYKVGHDRSRHALNDQELENFYAAVRLYGRNIETELNKLIGQA